MSVDGGDDWQGVEIIFEPEAALSLSWDTISRVLGGISLAATEAARIAAPEREARVKVEYVRRGSLVFGLAIELLGLDAKWLAQNLVWDALKFLIGGLVARELLKDRPATSEIVSSPRVRNAVASALEAAGGDRALATVTFSKPATKETLTLTRSDAAASAQVIAVPGSQDLLVDFYPSEHVAFVRPSNSADRNVWVVDWRSGRHIARLVDRKLQRANLRGSIFAGLIVSADVRSETYVDFLAGRYASPRLEITRLRHPARL